jgi:hypothetical protein
VVAGPWLTMVASRLAARRATRPAALIAARRLADDPTAGFRAISGLVLAVFVGTCAIGIITTIVANDGNAGTTASANGTLVDFLEPQSNGASTSILRATSSRLASIPGVTAVGAIHAEPDPGGQVGPLEEVISCADVARLPALGHCPPGADTATIMRDFGGGIIDRSSMPDTTWADAGLTITQLNTLPLDTVVVGTDGSTAAAEQARTVLDLAYGGMFAPQLISEIHADKSRRLDAYRRLADVVILTSLPIAGCSLAVSIAGGLAERKRPFSLLRLTGAPLGMLRRVISLEAAAPLLVTAAVSAGSGLLAAQLFARAQLAETLRPPGVQYYLVIAAGLLASLGVIASTLPLLKRVSGPETARNE